ncbi:hypothetical protein H072_7300 [Dactylellina haptotyla CBS 200.50]|uniref:Uncharacterized protein n=1 Tax=Dactylellina haptotyla (strain CBS 200.50) TaxID=1284197 RepID=S8A7V3_DACHA|nr:hypothetical protein H072_7300 [Dactylellina haptotyla CBS 200.50]
MSAVINLNNIFGLANKSGPIESLLVFVANNQVCYLQTAEPNTLVLPVEKRPLDLPLGDRPIIWGPVLPQNDHRNPIWNIFGLNAAGTQWKFQVHGGPVWPTKQDYLEAPKLLLSGQKEVAWTLTEHAIGQYSIYVTTSDRKQLYWSVAKAGISKAVVLREWNPSLYIQIFFFVKTSSGSNGDNRGN